MTAPILNRQRFIQELEQTIQWDVLVIGGGATGLGVAVDAASRGYKTLVLEQADFAKGTSSRSTKLVHGGVRYLAQGNIRLVYEALRERGLLLRNAPHLVRRQAFVIPCYNWFSVSKYYLGLKVYDWLSGRLSLGSSRFLNRDEVLQKLPGIRQQNLAGGIAYYDGQFDDARLAINLAQTGAEQGGVLLNYFSVTGLQKEEGKVVGVTATDGETGKEYRVQAKAVVNATGVFVDGILQMDRPGCQPLVRPSQGVHLVLDRSFLNTDCALMIPQTPDGRVLFAVPWHQHVLVGTTDTPLHRSVLEPEALQEEVTFILQTVQQYLHPAPKEKDVLSVFAGLRPLAAPQADVKATKEISRDHKLMVTESGLITITGGKWTTYRKMGAEVVDKAVQVAGLSPVESRTKNLKLHGSQLPTAHPFSFYGSDASGIEELVRQQPALENKLAAHLPYTEASVVWAVRNEMARTAEDVLARRLRILFLDAQAAIDAAPRVVELLAAELNKDAAWKEQQLIHFRKLARQYLIGSFSAGEVLDQQSTGTGELIC